MEIMADAVDAREVPTHILTVALILIISTILFNINITMIINATRSSLTPQDDENTPP